MSPEMLEYIDLHQSAALPIYKGKICLITSRSGKRWIIPKGCLELGTTSGEIALQEAWEEAGITGALSEAPVGSFISEKAGLVRCVVTWLLQVTEIADQWPEDEFRDRCLVTPEEALSLVKEKGLLDLIRHLLLPDSES